MEPFDNRQQPPNNAQTPSNGGIPVAGSFLQAAPSALPAWTGQGSQEGFAVGPEEARSLLGWQQMGGFPMPPMRIAPSNQQASFLTGVQNFRLIPNVGHQGGLHPAALFTRSSPYQVSSDHILFVSFHAQCPHFCRHAPCSGDIPND